MHTAFDELWLLWRRHNQSLRLSLASTGHNLALKRNNLNVSWSGSFKIITDSEQQLSKFTFFPSVTLVNMTIWETFSCQTINQNSSTVFCLGPKPVSKEKIKTTVYRCYLLHNLLSLCFDIYLVLQYRLFLVQIP